VRLFYPAVFLACALPGVHLGWQFYSDLTRGTSLLGVNPAETLLHSTGRDTLGLLFATLSVTPIRRISGWNRIQRVRRTLGLWAFFYACCHLLSYVVFNELGDPAAIWDDVTTRPFIFVGMFAFTILLALALTSTNGMIRRLGRRWQMLHRLVYVAAVAGIVHFIWGQKADIREPLIWAAGLALLLGWRVVQAVRRRRERLVPAVSR
jgi:sulfoxide reductase heme-binding subunit YedZ